MPEPMRPEPKAAKRGIYNYPDKSQAESDFDVLKIIGGGTTEGGLREQKKRMDAQKAYRSKMKIEKMMQKKSWHAQGSGPFTYSDMRQGYKGVK